MEWSYKKPRSKLSLTLQNYQVESVGVIWIFCLRGWIFGSYTITKWNLPFLPALGWMEWKLERGWGKLPSLLNTIPWVKETWRGKEVGEGVSYSLFLCYWTGERKESEEKEDIAPKVRREESLPHPPSGSLYLHISLTLLLTLSSIDHFGEIFFQLILKVSDHLTRYESMLICLDVRQQ